jgi:hypothetical protein
MLRLVFCHFGMTTYPTVPRLGMRSKRTIQSDSWPRMSNNNGVDSQQSPLRHGRALVNDLRRQGGLAGVPQEPQASSGRNKADHLEMTTRAVHSSEPSGGKLVLLDKQTVATRSR